MSTTTEHVTIDTTRPDIPFARLVKVELRKMFDTRAGRWLMISIAVLSVLAAVAVILFAEDSFINYSSFRWASSCPSSRSCR
jgi:hypothetical protein